MVRRALLIDDDYDMRSALADALDAFGWEAYPTESIEEARYVLEAWRPNLLLLDLHGSGDAARLARAAAADGVSIVLVSGSSADYLARARQELRAAGVLTKPFALQTLRTLLATLPPDRSVPPETTGLSWPVTEHRLSAPPRGPAAAS
jgi:DNA-binding response OmpR family regulator